MSQRKKHQRIEDGRAETGTQKHEFSAETVSQHSPHEIGEEEADQSGKGKNSDPGAPLGIISEPKSVFHKERNKRTAHTESRQ